MNRRNFFTASALAGFGARSAAAAAGRHAIFELAYIRLRNTTTNQAQRTNDFLSKQYLPAAQRAGIGPVGFFAPVIGQGSPFVMILQSFPSLGAMAEAGARLAADKEFQKAGDEYNAGIELPYLRIENMLLRGFDSMPQIEVPPVEGKRAPRIFEMRTYEANQYRALQRKIRMFDEGEIGIFRRLGMSPIFFGHMFVGPNLPNLTYMLAFDDLAHRERAWRAFGADPEWQKMRANPELADALIVSNISNSILRPLPFSPIR